MKFCLKKERKLREFCISDIF